MIVLIIPLVAVMLWPFPRFFHPPIGPISTGGDLRVAAQDTITLCLVDARKGDSLWFHLQPIGMADLRNPSDVERLIGAAYSKFREATHQ